MYMESARRQCPKNGDPKSGEAPETRVHITAETSYNLYWADTALMKLLLIAKLPASSSSLELCLQQMQGCRPYLKTQNMKSAD